MVGIVRKEWGDIVVYAYRSHLSKHVIVILMPERLTPNEEPKYLGIRIQPSIILEHEVLKYYEWRYSTILKDINYSSLMKVVSRLGWYINTSRVTTKTVSQKNT